MSARERVKALWGKIPTPCKWIALALLLIALLAAVEFLGFKGRHYQAVCDRITARVDQNPGWDKPEYVDYQPIVRNRYSRPCKRLRHVNGIVVHYVANPGTSAAANRNYFAGLALSGATYASSHFIVGLSGETLQLIPLREIAYCSNDRNADTISIECCHPDESGQFNEETYAALVALLADLCRTYDLDPATDVIRHYDVTGKLCPKYYVENPEAWEGLLADLAAALETS